jgi:hypothetical protein
MFMNEVVVMVCKISYDYTQNCLFTVERKIPARLRDLQKGRLGGRRGWVKVGA